MIELHPFISFVPKNSKYLIIGTFPGKPGKTGTWFYGAKRNQFWPILENVYNKKLNSIQKKKGLLSSFRIGLSDIILSCERKSGLNSDNNLTNITFNTKVIKNILTANKIKKVFFTSRYAKKLFCKALPYPPQTSHHKSQTPFELIVLPSPSPRYAKLTLSGKIKRYKKLLPGQ